ncbi:MAG TPA: hypothetical protein VMW17_19390 [Candidatus Binatia bacterium]|nr:hypothetical protein [Candidatus Binatia bacterium]
MAKVWFVRRNGAEWVAPGGVPACQVPLSDLTFKLDLGPQRWLSSECPMWARELPQEEWSRLSKVLVETDASDLSGKVATTYRVGFYDSPYPPVEAARRLGLR